MKLSIEVETERYQDARVIAQGLRRWAELERAGVPVAVHVTAGRAGRSRLPRLVSPRSLRPGRAKRL